MAARHQRNETVRMRPPRRSWLALPLAILSNALLFYVLASVRTTPAAPRMEEKHTLPVVVVPIPVPESAELPPVLPEPDYVPVVSAARLEAEAAALPDMTAIPGPRLLSGVEAAEAELPGLPVLLPGRADLRSVPSASASGVELPHSLLVL